MLFRPLRFLSPESYSRAQVVTGDKKRDISAASRRIERYGVKYRHGEELWRQTCRLPFRQRVSVPALVVLQLIVTFLQRSCHKNALIGESIKESGNYVNTMEIRELPVYGAAISGEMTA